jgi:TM2 domain-containing membrane protein YozV
MSSYSDYSGNPPAEEPVPAPPSWPDGQAQARPQEQYGAQPEYGAQPQYGVQPYARQQGYPAGTGQPQGQLVVAPKNPAVSLIASFFIPGLGSMISGRVGIGILILGIYVVGLILTFIIIGFPIALGAWVWGMIDGYQSAVNWNRAHGIIS